MVFAIVVCVGVLVAMSQNGGIGGGTNSISSAYKTAYKEFTNKLHNGDEAPEDGELIYPLTFNTLDGVSYTTDPTITKYFDELSEKYEKLKTEAKNNSELTSKLTSFGTTLKVLENTVNYPAKFSELVKKYQESSSNAEAYFKENFDYNNYSDNLKTIVAFQSDFYAARMSEYIIYANVSCVYNNGDYDYGCILLQGSAEDQANVNEYSEMIIKRFNNMTSEAVLSAFNSEILNSVKELSGE